MNNSIVHLVLAQAVAYPAVFLGLCLNNNKGTFLVTLATLGLVFVCVVIGVDKTSKL